MTSSKRMIRRIGVLGAAGLALTVMALNMVAGTAAAPPLAQPIQVVVTNTPLPVSGDIGVSGTVNVGGTVSATQSGAWNVGISGTPTVRSGDSTVLLGSFAGDVPGGGAFTQAVNQADATPYRSVRVMTNCFLGGACANIIVRVYTVVGNRSYLVDQFPMQNFVVSTSVYEVIGTNVQVQLLNNNPDTSTNIGVSLFGRSN